MTSKIISIITVIAVLVANTVISTAPAEAKQPVKILSSNYYSLSDRYSNTYVNNVFSDNILLTLAYMRGIAKKGKPIDWDSVKSDFTYRLVIKPGQTFAFHDAILPQYKNVNIETSNAHFNSMEGFESDGWLVGDGVCHLASFMNVVAREANLEVVSPTPHNFAKIADVPRQYAIAIYYSPNDIYGSSMQNLYITNTFDTPIAFVFEHTGSALHIWVEKSI